MYHSLYYVQTLVQKREYNYLIWCLLVVYARRPDSAPSEVLKITSVEILITDLRRYTFESRILCLLSLPVKK